MINNSRQKILDQFVDFKQRNLLKLEKVHDFQKKNASNELNIEQSKWIFYDKPFIYK